MPNLLYISNIAGKRMSYGFVGSAIKASHALGLDFYSVANRAQATETDIKEDEKAYKVKLLHIPLCRSPFSFRNIKAYRQLCNIILENKIDYIHCNTPVGGLLGRIAGKKCKVKKVIYQVHGFHFYKGAPKKNWFLYYPIEKWMTRYTDALITINREDFARAKRAFTLRGNGKIYYVPGVGINVEPYRLDSPEEARRAKREELGLSSSDFVVLSVGRLDKNKNNKTLLEAVYACKNPEIHLVLCGDGEERNALSSYAKEMGIEKQIHFLGNRADMPELYNMADGFLMASFREGLSRSIMEAMASGLPCIVSRIRGNVDLIVDGKGGFLCETNDVAAYAEKLNLLANDKALRETMGKNNLITIKQFSIETVSEEIRKIYEAELGR